MSLPGQVPPPPDLDRQNPTDDNADGGGGEQSELGSSSPPTSGNMVLTWPYRFSIAMREVIRSGRGVRRLVTLCGSIQQLVRENDRRLLDTPDGEDDNEDTEVTQPPEDPQELERRSVFVTCRP